MIVNSAKIVAILSRVERRGIKKREGRASSPADLYSSSGTNASSSLMPMPSASRWSVLTDGLPLPRSSRLITLCRMPLRSASACCVSPLRRRASTSACAASQCGSAVLQRGSSS